jgi:hypothetical protein
LEQEKEKRMMKLTALAAVGVAATALMLATPATSEARGGHGGGHGGHAGHGGHGHHHGSYHRHSRGYYGGNYYYRSGWFGGRRNYYYRSCYVPVNNCWWTTCAGQWVQHETDKAYFAYYVNGIQVAGYDSNTGVYRTYDATTDTWSAALTPPWGQGNPNL